MGLVFFSSFQSPKRKATPLLNIYEYVRSIERT
jgi:hypothetical protein